MIQKNFYEPKNIYKNIDTLSSEEDFCAGSGDPTEFIINDYEKFKCFNEITLILCHIKQNI